MNHISIIAAWDTHQSIYKNLSTLLTLMEGVNVCQLLQKIHHGYGNMFFQVKGEFVKSMLIDFFFKWATIEQVDLMLPRFYNLVVVDFPSIFKQTFTI